MVRLEAVRLRRQAIAEMERGNIEGARAWLRKESEYITASAPSAPLQAKEAAEIEALDSDLENGEVRHATKMAKHSSYTKRRGR